jgi:hypothetical protein
MTPLDRLASYLASLHPKWRETSWDNIGEETREVFREDARGALKLLREPSQAMLDAGEYDDHHPSGTWFGGGLLEESWTRMIDSALSE